MAGFSDGVSKVWTMRVLGNGLDVDGHRSDEECALALLVRGLWSRSEDDTIARLEAFKVQVDELIQRVRDEAARERAWEKPPCQECGAMTLEDAQQKCLCGGDRDDCHGTKLWPK